MAPGVVRQAFDLGCVACDLGIDGEGPVERIYFWSARRLSELRNEKLQSRKNPTLQSPFHFGLFGTRTLTHLGVPVLRLLLAVRCGILSLGRGMSSP